MEKARSSPPRRVSLLQLVVAFVVVGWLFWPKVQDDRIPKKQVKESYLLALLDNKADEWSKKYTAEAHLPGTNYQLVEWTESKMQEYGFETTIDQYDIYVSYPNEHSLKVLANSTEIYEASLKEDELKEDETSSGPDLVPTFLSYAANGNVTAEYIYCNFGSVQDFAELKEANVSVEGKIAVMRYGGIFRGLKVKHAQEAGAVGALLYSDPKEDGNITTANGYKAYPKGPARNPSSVQRGSVQFLSTLPGDPTTPGYASKPGVPRTDPHGSTPKIPVLLISYKEVEPILHHLNGFGEEFGEHWQGALSGYNYSIGPRPGVELNLYSDQIFNITPLWNVYGQIEGVNKEEVIIVGNHRDAWVKGGAGDPNSGSAVLIEIMRALHELSKSGWKPQKTIMFASWDGEEYALLGSTEFGEFLSHKLQKTVVAYLNLDVATTGSILSMGASPLLNSVLRSAAEQLKYPNSTMNLWEHFKQHNDEIAYLGSGSDYTVFLEHLGIPASDMSFRPAKDGPIYHYHSNYDSYHWMSTYGDPGFVFHNLMAKYLGLVLLELSETETLFFKTQDYAVALSGYFEKAAERIPESWLHRKVHVDTLDRNYDFNQELSNLKSSKHMLGYALGETSRTCGRKHKPIAVAELIDEVKKELESFSVLSTSFDDYVLKLLYYWEHKEDLWWWDRIKLHYKIIAVNKRLKYLERNFLHCEGLKDRSWFKHIIFASGRYTGYKGQTLPGLQEAIEDDDFESGVKWLEVIWKAVRRVDAQLDH